MRAFLIFLATTQGLLWGGALAARADRVEEIVTRLRHEGYRPVEVTRTWLGRYRILAEGAPGAREIVVDPRNGEVLRDYTAPHARANGPAPGRGAPAVGSVPTGPPEVAAPKSVPAREGGHAPGRGGRDAR